MDGAFLDYNKGKVYCYSRATKTWGWHRPKLFSSVLTMLKRAAKIEAWRRLVARKREE